MASSETAAAKKIITAAIKLAVTAGLIWFLASKVDFNEAAQQLKTVTLPALAGAFVLLCVQVTSVALRWHLIVHREQGTLPLGVALRLTFEGMFFNQALPSGVGGDAVRIYRVTRYGLRLGRAINSVLIDRIGGLAGLLILVLVSQPLLYQKVVETEARLGFAALLAIGFGAIASVMVLSKLPQALRRFRIVDGLVGLSRALRRILLTPASGLPVLLLAVFGHVCAVTALYIMGRSMGLEILFTDMLVIVPAVLLIAMLPISIAGWGLREAAMINGLALIGASQSGALALSVLFGLLLIAVGLPGGILWLIDRKKLPREELLGATETEGKL